MIIVLNMKKKKEGKKQRTKIEKRLEGNIICVDLTVKVWGIAEDR